MALHMSNGFKITAVVLALIFLAGGAVFSAMTFFSVHAMAQAQEESSGYEEFASSEDGVVIAGEYTIRPTTAISEAYRTGDDSKLSDKEKETLAMASAILDEICTDGMSDYEKERAVYDWMVQNLAYDEGALVVIPTSGSDSDNPYGVLKYHNAVCVGYATTFRLFMQMLDIPCMVVHNNDLYHSWDLVQLDGHWYHVDIYADVGETGYANFNLPDAIRLQQQTWDTSFFPAADALTYNVSWQNRQEVSDIYAVPAALRKALDESLPTFMLTFSEPISSEEQEVVERMVYALDNALMETSSPDQPDRPDSIREWNWTAGEEDDQMALRINFYYSTGGVEPAPLDDEAWAQAEAALQDAFDDLFYLSLDNGYYWDYEGAVG